MEQLKIFNETGEIEFGNFLNELKINPTIELIDLNDKKYYSLYTPIIELDQDRKFSSRFELAEYLVSAFNNAGLKRSEVLGNNKLWTWLTYFWFDQICPIVDGKRKVLQIAKYICGQNFRTYYRHFIASTYNIYSLLGKSNTFLFLYQSINIHNDFIEQLASRQDIISQSNLIQAAQSLYWNDSIKKPKPAATDRKKQGNLRRLIRIFGQIELTYDIFSMKSDEILNLLPKEFNGWKS
jgi:hypothetical protein